MTSVFSLINKIKPGIVKKINRLSTPIAGLVSNGIKYTIWDMAPSFFNERSLAYCSYMVLLQKPSKFSKF